MESNKELAITPYNETLYDMDNRNPRFEKNNKGVDIKVCCASCRSEEPEDGLLRSERTKNYRRCTLTGGVCEKQGVCGNWGMKDSLMNWKGVGTGRVKSLGYLTWYRTKYLEWKKLEEEAPEAEKPKIKQEYLKFCHSAHKTYEDSGKRLYVL